MSKLRKQFIGVLTVLCCALLALSATLLMPKNKTAEAYSSTSMPTSADVGELYNGADAQNTFNSNNLKTLYQKLTDNSSATLSNVASLASANTTITSNVANYSSTVSVTVAGTPVANKNIIVEFGGLLWTAVFVSKAEKDLGGTTSDPTKAGYAADGDVVLTLWLANPTEIAQWNTNYSASTSATYPSNMYGISYMRSVVLNNGGQYWTSDTTLSSDTSPGDKNPYGFSKFTADYYYSNKTGGTRIPSTIKDYLVSPRYIGWQYQQQASELGFVDGHEITAILKRNLNNDAWGSVGSSLFTCRDTYANRNNPQTQSIYYEGYDKYDAWKDDLLWLPSVTEVGWGSPTVLLDNTVGNSRLSDHPGLWQTTYDQRKYADGSDYADWNPDMVTWLRSGFCHDTGCVYRLFVPGLNCVRAAYDDYGPNGGANLVRPALHLNLTKAENAVAFGTSTNPSFEDSKDNNIKTVRIERVYDNQAAEIAVRDYLNLDPPTGGDTTQYNSTSGKFTATLPDTDKDKTYSLKVKPKTGCYWSDTLTNEERKYEIVIKALDVNVGWSNRVTGKTIGDSLLQKSNLLTSSSNTLSGVTFTEKYYKIYYASGSPTDESAPQGVQWTTRSSSTESTAFFKADKAGTYRIFYEISSQYHNTKIGYYDVVVAAGSTTLSVTGEIDSVTYGDGDLVSSVEDERTDWLKEAFESAVSVSSSNVSIDDLLSEYNIVLFYYKNGTRYDAELNSHDYYDVNTYYMDLEPAGDNVTYAVSWAKDSDDNYVYPSFEVTKRAVTVKAVPATDGGELKSIYGNNPVSMKFTLVSQAAAGEDINDIGLNLNKFYIKGTTKSITNSTDANPDPYEIVGAEGTGNYEITFNSALYTVEPRPITLKIEDQTVGYGVDLNGYTFKEMTLKDGEFVGSVDIAALMASAEYKVMMLNGSEANKSSLLIGKYDLCATIETGNYVFTIESGTLTVTQGTFDMSGITLDNAGHVYDGQPHAAQISGKLPSDEITVSYRYVDYNTNEELDGAPVEVGMYLVYASFSHENPNYNPITTVKAAYIRIAYTEEEANADFPPLPTDEELAANADLAKKKTEAKKTLDEEAQKKKDEIDADVNLSAEEKKAAKDEIDKELKEGNAAIDKAKDKDGVDKAYDDGKKEIEDTTELAKKKGTAKSELDKAAQAKKDAIDANPELTDEEKAAAKAEVDKELEEGKKAIDGANSIDGVSSAESSTKTNIENIKAEHKGDFPWWILAIIAGAILLVTVLIIVIVKRRSADDDDGGYDDYYDDEYDYDEEEVEDDGDEAYGY